MCVVPGEGRERHIIQQVGRAERRPALLELMSPVQQVFAPQSPACPACDWSQLPTPPQSSLTHPCALPSLLPGLGGRDGLPLLRCWLQQP